MPDVIEHAIVWAEDSPALAGGVAIAALFGASIVIKAARAARGLSDDGLYKLEAARRDEWRVGQRIEGRLRMTKPPKAGERFKVQLLCIRKMSADGGGDMSRTAYAQESDATPFEDAGEWFLAFEFDVPADMPSTSPAEGYSWTLRAAAPDRWISALSSFEIIVGPPEN